MSKKRLKIGVIFGGKSFEHEVSLISAKSIIKALDKNKYKIIPIGITKKGKWLFGRNARALLEGKRIQSRGVEKCKMQNAKCKIDVFFPILHGPYGEDGRIQGCFEMMDKPYVGAAVLASAIGMDKAVQKIIFRAVGLPVGEFIYFTLSKKDCEILRRLQKGGLHEKRGRGDAKSILPLSEIEKEIKYPCFVKPVNSGSSVGISKATKRKELIKAVKIASKFDRKIVIEKAIKNAREIEISILENEDPIVSLPGEIIPSGEFYDYKAKYIDEGSQLIAPAKLGKSLIKKLQELAITAYKIIGCAGMARLDFLLERPGLKIYLNEINTIPGFTPISMYPKLWEVSGLPYPKLLDKLINLAIERHKTRKFRTEI